MKIKYQFVNETTEVEVEETLGNIIVDLDRRQYNNDHRETRRHISLSRLSYEGHILAQEDNALTMLFTDESEKQKLHKAISLLKPKQQELIKAIFYEGISVNDYASREGVDQSAISHRLRVVKNNLKKLLKKPHI